VAVAAFLAHSLPLVLIAAVSPVLFLNASRVVEAAGMKTNKIRVHNYDLKHCLTPYDNVLVPARTAPSLDAGGPFGRLRHQARLPHLRQFSMRPFVTASPS
jgi:hypothetical protein